MTDAIPIPEASDRVVEQNRASERRQIRAAEVHAVAAAYERLAAAIHAAAAARERNTAAILAETAATSSSKESRKPTVVQKGTSDGRRREAARLA